MVSSEAWTFTMALNWNDAALAAGLRCFNEKEFFAAHEHWESVWLKCREPEKSFLQALIQVASAFHHHQNGNLRGTTSLLNRAIQKLEAMPDCFEQIDVAVLRSALVNWCRTLESETPTAFTSYPQIEVADPHRDPKNTE